MRLTVRVKLTGRYRWFYDVGLRDDDNILSSETIRGGRIEPRFLEDIIEEYGASQIEIQNYGTLINRYNDIRKLLGDN